MENILAKLHEETIEDRIDRINTALQSTIIDLDTSNQIRTASRASHLNSYTASFCNYDWVDGLNVSNYESKLDTQVEETLETLLTSLDRVQMQNEDFLSDILRFKPQYFEESQNYIRKLEKENKELRSRDRKQFQQIETQKNKKLEQERKNFEAQLLELDSLVSTYKSKHVQLLEIEENLKIREKLLEQKEKETRQMKMDLDRSKIIWEQSVTSSLKGSDKVLRSSIKENIEAPPPMTPNRSNQILALQQSLKINEVQLSECSDENEKSKLVIFIDMLKNKIAALRGEEVILQCSKSSKVLKSMTKTMEKQVFYEENLRKMNLEKFSTRGSNKNTPSVFKSPVNLTSNSKRFLFREE